ncbi:MAG: transcription termination/antitermination protein NusG [Beijerinckiaceae bacterium]
MDWFVLYTKSQSEARAAEGVERHGFESFLPVLRRQVRRRGKRIVIERPLFPRYIFIGFAAPPPWLDVLRIEGVLMVIGNQGKPLRVDSAIVDRLRERVASGEFERRSPPAIRPGMTVRIGAGPMESVEGVCMAVTGDARADLFVRMLNQTVRLKIAVDQLVAVA